MAVKGQEEVSKVIFFILLALLGAQAEVAASGNRPETGSKEITIKMPKVHPKEPETYLCTNHRLTFAETNYIVGFRPLADGKVAHHMLLYGCKNPGLEDPTYNCGAMTVKTKGLSSALNPCGFFSKSSVIYAWAKNAPELTLPDGVGFRVGGPKADVDWLVLQVHYASIDHIPAEGDESGLSIIYTNVPQPKAAGVLFTSASGWMPAKRVTNVEVACKVGATAGRKPIHPFAFRVHTHELGTLVSGYKVNKEMRWTLIGKQDPQIPQMFFPAADDSLNSIEMDEGDWLATRCTIDNVKDHAVYMGTTRQDEMCNYYMMYWVEGADILPQSYCSSLGYPLYSWDGWMLGSGLSNIPPDASDLD